MRPPTACLALLATTATLLLAGCGEVLPLDARDPTPDAGADAPGACQPGEPRWSRTYGTSADEVVASRSALARTADGDYLLAGATGPRGGAATGTYLLKIAPDGSERWTQQYGDTGVAGFTGVVARDSGAFACGTATAGKLGCTQGAQCGFCLATSATGGVAWQHSSSAGSGDRVGMMAVAPAASGFVAASYTNDTGDAATDAAFTTVNSTGTGSGTLWYRNPGEDRLLALHRAADGSYYGAGYLGGGDSCQRPWLVHLNASGSKLGELKANPCLFESEGAQPLRRAWATAVVPRADGSVVSVGRQYVDGHDADAFLAVTRDLDTAPVEAWRRTYGAAGDDIFHAVELLPDGGMLVVGTTRQATLGGTDTYVLRTDAAGVELWHRTYGGAGDDTGVALAPGPDGSYLVVGTTASSGAGGRDVFAMAIDLCE